MFSNIHRQIYFDQKVLGYKKEILKGETILTPIYTLLALEYKYKLKQGDTIVHPVQTEEFLSE